MGTPTLALLLLFLSVIPAGAPARAQGANSTAQLDQIFRNLTDNHSPGLAVLVRQNGRTLFEREYGVRDLKTQTAIDAQTNFRLASCTKQFTAMAVMLLVQDGKLRYDESLTQIFPDFRPMESPSPSAICSITPQAFPNMRT